MFSMNEIFAKLLQMIWSYITSCDVCQQWWLISEYLFGNKKSLQLDNWNKNKCKLC